MTRESKGAPATLAPALPKLAVAEQVCAVTYDQRFLDQSWQWLTDPELRELTLAPLITKGDQLGWFASLSGRKDYLIWGIELAGRPLGAFGLKHIDAHGGEYWGYIGEKAYWGCGIGGWMLQKAMEQAQGLGLQTVRLIVSGANLRAIKLYHRYGFRLMLDDGTALHMEREVGHAS